LIQFIYALTLALLHETQLNRTPLGRAIFLLQPENSSYDIGCNGI